MVVLEGWLFLMSEVPLCSCGYLGAKGYEGELRWSGELKCSGDVTALNGLHVTGLNQETKARWRHATVQDM